MSNQNRATHEIRNKLVASLAAILLFALAATGTLDAMLEDSFVSHFDTRAHQYFSESISRSAYTFAIVRGINGVISVLQGTEVAVSPAGIGVRLAMGEILDPVNDLVERFSWVMLVSATSLGIQKILMEMAGWFGFRILFSFSMLVLLAAVWLPRDRMHFKSLARRLILASILIRFCIPAVAVASAELYRLFLEKDYIESTRGLEDINTEIKSSAVMTTSGKKGENPEADYLEKLRVFYENTRSTLHFRERISELQEKISHYAEYTINLIIVFILQTILLPILVLWAIIRFTGCLLRPSTGGI